MGLTYDKKLIKKDRAITSTGPRDHQRRQQASGGNIDSALIDTLKEQISDLQDKLERSSKNTSDGWTDDQVNSEIEKAVTSELRIAKSEYETTVSVQRDRLATLEENLKTFKESRQKDAEILEHTRNENTKLKSENSVLKEKIASKDELIAQLKESSSAPQISEEKLAEIISAATKNIQVNASTGEVTDRSRPQMETVFVDPSENSNAESHIVIEDISTTEKEQINNKLSKLKGLMGKLPVKR